MPIINGFDRHQISFSSLEVAITTYNEVGFIDTFLNTKKAGALPAALLQLFLATNPQCMAIGASVNKVFI